MSIATAKISSKGQVTIPKKIRDYLQSETVCFDVKEDGSVVLQPVRDAAGALNKYAHNKKTDADFNALREKAWEDALREKSRRKSS